MPYNYAKIRGKIREVCGTQSVFSEKMGISSTTLSLKLNNKAEWSQNEMLKAMDILGIDKKNIEEYFFCSNDSIF